MARTFVLRRVAGRLLRAAAQRDLVPRYMAGTINGFPIRLDLKEKIDRAVYLEGMHDKRGVLALNSLLERMACRTAFDVGANIGDHAAFYATRARRVFAFEPNPRVFRTLQGLAGETGPDNLHVREIGLSDRSGRAAFYVTQGSSGGGSVNASDAGCSFEIALVRGDDFVAEEGIDDLDFIKIDAEGHDLDVLAGLRDTICAQRPVIVTEISAEDAKSASVLDRLAGLMPGYRFFGNHASYWSKIRVRPFRFREVTEIASYSHLACVPEEKADVIAHLADTRI